MSRSLPLLLIVALSVAPAAAQEEGANPRVLLETSHGPIVIELEPARAPRTVESFLGYVRSGFYEGTVFHRVIPGFMIQGGGFTAEMEKKPTEPPVQNEADNGLKNLRGTLAVARTGDPHSASSQFFINLVDNDYLNHTAKTPQGWGYTVFGRVLEGMETADAIAGVRTARKGAFSDVPVEPVRITGARVIEGATASAD